MVVESSAAYAIEANTFQTNFPHKLCIRNSPIVQPLARGVPVKLHQRRRRIHRHGRRRGYSQPCPFGKSLGLGFARYLAVPVDDAWRGFGGMRAGEGRVDERFQRVGEFGHGACVICVSGQNGGGGGGELGETAMWWT